MLRFRIRKSAFWGILAAAFLIALFFTAVSLISGPSFAFSQFNQFWYYIVALALGFGIQISFYSFLRQNLAGSKDGKIAAVTGGTSTTAMLSCCAHYLANILPILGISGIASIVAQYQTRIFWVGIAFNLAGIIFIGSRILKLSKHV